MTANNNNVEGLASLAFKESRIESVAGAEHKFILYPTTKSIGSKIKADFNKAVEGKLEKAKKVGRIAGRILLGLAAIVGVVLAIPFSILRSIVVGGARVLSPSVKTRANQLEKAAKKWANLSPVDRDAKQYGKLQEAAANYVNAIARGTSSSKEVVEMLRKTTQEMRATNGATFALGLNRTVRGNAIDEAFKMAESALFARVLLPRVKEEVATAINSDVLSGTAKTSVVREKVGAILPYAKKEDGSSMTQAEVEKTVLESLRSLDGLQEMKTELRAQRSGVAYKELKSKFDEENNAKISVLEDELGTTPGIFGGTPEKTGHRYTLQIVSKADRDAEKALRDFLRANTRIDFRGASVEDGTIRETVSGTLSALEENYNTLKAAADEAKRLHDAAKEAVEVREKDLKGRKADRSSSGSTVSGRVNDKIALINAIEAGQLAPRGWFARTA